MVGSVSSDPSRPVVILGAGLAGLSTALHLPADRPWLLVEREQRVGGKARSRRRDGYTFDVTGHWLHLRDDRVRALVDDLFDAGDLVEIERRTGVYTHGAMLAYPFQANLHGLPLPVVAQCLQGFVQAQVAAALPDAPAPRTFGEFARMRFGAGIAEHFFIPYNTKLWGTSPDTLTADWVQRFVPMPDVAQVVGGALGIRQDGLGYNAHFLYPRAGGIDALPEAMGRRLSQHGSGRVRLGAGVERIDPAQRRVRMVGGNDWIDYDTLVSTIPLPALVRAIDGAPPAVLDAASRLRCVPWRWLDIATKTRPPMAEHWVYVPEPRLPFFRVGCYSNAWPAMAPPGAGALYVELADRDNLPDLPTILDGLAEMGAITSPDDVAFVEQHDLPCAYVMFDEHHREATETIGAWLHGLGIRSCGRYGSWTYNSMEDAIVAGMEAARWTQD
jgi:protoporphyrinogen oxidase